MYKTLSMALAACLWASSVLAAETIEAIGAEKCGGARAAYTVEFLAPEDTQVEARAKPMIRGGEDERNPTTLSLDGKPCSEGRCTFRATKGQTYKLAATSTGPKVDSLCISVSRP